MGKEYDVAVLGGSAAGYALACTLAADGRNVIVLEFPAGAAESPLGDWVPGNFFRTNHLPPKLPQACRAVPFTKVCYHDAGLKRQAVQRFRGAAGYLLDSGRLRGALRDLAKRAGVECRGARAAPAIALEEQRVVLGAPAWVVARMLVIAQGQPQEAVSALGLPVRSLPRSNLAVAALDVPVRGRTGAPALAGGLNVAEMKDPGDLGMFFLVGGVLHLRAISASPEPRPRAAELSAMLTGLRQAGLVPDSLELGRARGALWRPPAGVALELDVHVAKRCLLIGSAGGFVEPLTGQTLMPTVRSAVLVAQTLRQALRGEAPQETLMQFKTAWRESLAESLRPPNASLRMLLPLLFVNRQILARFTEALLHGGQI